MGEDATAELARDAVAGDREAFAQLFHAERDAVARLCARMLADPTAAEDAASEVFLRARRSLRRFDPERPFRGWVLGIASHYCIDQLRRRSLESRLFTAADPDDDRLRDTTPDPLKRLSNREEQRRVLAAIDALPARHRLPLVMRFYQELDYAEIGNVLGIPRSQVGSLLYRAKRALRLSLEADDARTDAAGARGSGGQRRRARRESRDPGREESREGSEVRR